MISRSKNVFPCHRNLSDLTVAGEIAGQAVQLLVDTGAGVSAIDERLFTKMYGQFLFISVQTVQKVNGEEESV